MSDYEDYLTKEKEFGDEAPLPVESTYDFKGLDIDKMEKL